MADKMEDKLRKTGDNLRRLMANLGFTVERVADKSGLDKRTIKGILDGTTTPQLRTIGHLAKGLGVSSDEFFIDPVQLLYRRFDRVTNPLVDEVVQTRPEVFAGWTTAEFDELHSRFGTGGPLTVEGTLTVAQEMNSKRGLHEKLALLLESSQADVIAGIIELLCEKVVTGKEQHQP